MRPTLTVEEWRRSYRMTYSQIYEMVHGEDNVMMSSGDGKGGLSLTVDKVPDVMWFKGMQNVKRYVRMKWYFLRD